jgi:hypothetical protein
MSTNGQGRRSGSRSACIVPKARVVPADWQRFVVGTPVVEQLPTDALLDGFHRPATTADRPALVGSWNGGRDDG